MEEKGGTGSDISPRQTKMSCEISIKELVSGANRNAHATNKPPDSLLHKGYRPSAPYAAHSTARNWDRIWPDTT